MTPRRTALRAAAFAAAITTTVAGGALVAPAASAQGSSNAPAPAFYQPPADLPNGSGALIKTEAFPLAGALPDIPGAEALTDGAGPMSTDAQRIMYTSVGSRGQHIAVTGTYLQPRAPWAGAGSRPLAVIAPGTQGQADHCAPSKTFQNVASVQTDPPGVGFGYEIIQAYALLARGYAVAVTDFEGLGTPGLHSYVHREAQARAVLDLARVAPSVPGSDTGPNPRTVFSGYSQGGGAVAAAAELHPEYAPEIDLVGTAAGSPPADLLATLDQADGSAIAGVIGYALNSLSDAYPELKERMDVHLTDGGQAMLTSTADQCIGETAVQFFQHRTANYTKTGRPAVEIVREDPVAMKYLEMQRVGRLKPTTPVRIVSPVNDDVVPGHQSQQLGRDWCAQGATVDMVIDPMPAMAPGLVIGHAAPMITGLDGNLRYLDDRINGLPAPSNCGTY
ncbi:MULTISPECIES: lipase family protein [Dietzia]|uniref:Lipase family protein n=1 Tax=Dietzia cinnamea TaxID=321318 RepID=A0ABV3YFK7_9ACTN|nr:MULTISPECIES: lipase family protein [Dietzia]MCT1640659.1 lipase family protein [Dietzia cinnamea]MCT2058871.1 lipase family protein [Dietzia cinnamea]MCT2062519.1 lipase family protein [Dietzia cinnamea]MCT2099005.1 lipase family protein [Dietzia cinnamea]MCT2121131.1 lipase family protein [Dietzia cinnamea]